MFFRLCAYKEICIFRKAGFRMAIYHCSIKIISRGRGKSAVAAAAYRSGEKITNDYDGITHDYTRKGGIAHTEILLPQNAPREFFDRAVLWNAVEKIEKAKNSQLAREIELALPAELTLEENISLARDYVQRAFVDNGMCADVCLHDKNDGNPHAHIMLTMRPFRENGEWGDKQKKEYILNPQGEKIYDPKKKQYKCRAVPTTDWNEQTKAEEWRAAWADAVNNALEAHKLEERVDHRSYERQGVEQIPTVHLGVATTQMEQRGIATDRGDMNREIAAQNNLLRHILDKLKELRTWLKDALTPKAPPTFADTIQRLLDTGDTSVGTPYGIKKILEFMKANAVSTLPEIREAVAQKQRGTKSIHDKLEILQILRAAEEIDRKLNPRVQKRMQKNSEWERS
jgi:ATP-dependent exoDNAse (exonuclease V) alpha subunit